MSTDPRTLAPSAGAELVDEVRAYLDAVDDLASTRAVLRLANKAARALDDAVLAATQLAQVTGREERAVDLLERLRAVVPYADAVRALRITDTAGVLLAAASVGLVDQAAALVDDPSRPPTHKPAGRPCTALRLDRTLCRAYALPWAPRPLCRAHATPEERAHNAERRAAWDATR